MYLSIGVSGHGRAEIIPNGQGNRMTPSCDALTYTDHLIGDADKNLSLFNPINTILCCKVVAKDVYSGAAQNIMNTNHKMCKDVYMKLRFHSEEMTESVGREFHPKVVIELVGLEPILARLAYQGPTQLEYDRANEMSNGNNVKSTSGEKILGILIPLVGLRKTHS
ncbi:uncharacterized protein LOC127903945 [Populus trichocarpa]|uniref:uncharacterized protein LOC127903945 n=1 Tax=Populus trichocarpa TaxID=3694 RepID=UPI002279AE6D|nr:uncharacterized protein LOC127903945 [Populus trichocarpa]